MSKRKHDKRAAEDVPAAPTSQLRIVAQGEAPLGKEQQTFNRLVKQLNRLRTTLAEWAAFDERHQKMVMGQLAPLHQKMTAVRRETILVIATILDGGLGPVPGKKDRRTLVTHLLELIGPQLAEVPDDEEIIALHDRHAPLTHAEDQELERQMTRDFAAKMLGVELDDDEIGGRSVDEILAAGLSKAREADVQAAQQRGRARSKRQRERDAKLEAATEQAAREVSQSVREVYRRLASALHPDRATDEADRDRRHALMQRANVAYEASDLLSLLTLQLELEQIDAAHLTQVSQTRLQHYNTVLREQVRELERELAQTRHRYALLLEGAFGPVSMPGIESALRREVREVRRAVRELEDHRGLLRDPVRRAAWIKDYARALRDEDRMEAQMLREWKQIEKQRTQDRDPFFDDVEYSNLFDDESIFDHREPPRANTAPLRRRPKPRR